jgi:glycosyltransferase involved in cell wall biosynthesis
VLFGERILRLRTDLLEGESWRISLNHKRITRVALFHPTDLLGNSPNGIDSYIRTILKFSPEDVDITLFGACDRTSDLKLRDPVAYSNNNRTAVWVPIIHLPSPIDRQVPLVARYFAGLVKAKCSGLFRDFDVLDFHRVEPSILFRLDSRPKSLVMHQDISGVVDAASEIRWQRFSYGYHLLEKMLLPAFQRAFLVRRQSLRHYVEAFPARAARFEFRPTFVDTTQFYPTSDDVTRSKVRSDVRHQLGLSASAQIVIYVGRLDRAKDPLMLVHAFRIAASKSTGLHLVVVGDGPLRPEVEAAILAAGLGERISLLGSKDKETIRLLLQASDLFLLASSYEGMPLALLEALACGIPVVSANVGEVGNILLDGQNGVLTPTRTPAAYAASIEVGLGATERMRGVACTRSVEHFSAASVLPRIYEQYRRLVRDPQVQLRLQ